MPEYWAGTPLYGEKLIPLLDYMLSTDYSHTDQLATAFYNISSKYKNTADLPIECIEEIIEESGYKYIRDLLGQDEESLKLLVYLLVMIHEFKGSSRGIEAVLRLLKTSDEGVVMTTVGDIQVSDTFIASGFTENDYIMYSNFSLSSIAFEVNFEITTKETANIDQCIASSPEHGFYLGINSLGQIVLKLGQKSSGLNSREWQEIDGITEFVSTRTLSKNTTYYIKFIFDGYDYTVKVSDDKDKYFNYVNVSSTTPLDIVGGYVYLGIDKSESETPQLPFKGEIALGPFLVSANDVKLEQWFEKFPVGPENTFSVEAALDGEVISANFFSNFSNFVKNYVYPTLIAFKANLSFKAKFTFLPYVRQKVTYVGASEEYTPEDFEEYM